MPLFNLSQHALAVASLSGNRRESHYKKKERERSTPPGGIKNGYGGGCIIRQF